MEGGINLFAYVAGNPLRWADSLGLWFDLKADAEGGLYIDTEGLDPIAGECLAKCAAKQFGITTILGGALIGVGDNFVPTRGKPGGPTSTKGTSIASKYLRKMFPQKLGETASKIPARTPATGLSGRTKTVGALLGRWVSFAASIAGRALWVWDIFNILSCTDECIKGKCPKE